MLIVVACCVVSFALRVCVIVCRVFQNAVIVLLCVVVIAFVVVCLVFVMVAAIVAFVSFVVLCALLWLFGCVDVRVACVVC